MRLGILGAALLLGLATSCGEPTPGDKAVGEACSDAHECRHGYCVGGPEGEQATCTRSCARTEECPRGWACSGVTADNVVVCVEGAPTPFGVGARE
ncbi:MAG: hypothetical protein AB8I08_21745 [Sandaracinaceae bacterium]